MGKTPGDWQLNVESLCELIHRATAESDDCLTGRPTPNDSD